MSRIKMLKKESQVALPTSGETYIADDGTVSMVLDDHHDDTYEPTEAEIKEYGEWLGMQLPEDEELIWIAREGLRAPLPKEWKPCKTDTGEVYYFNFKTGDSIWDHPMDEHFKNKFKQEKERLKKVKENGGVANDALSKLPQRNNVIFSEKGVIKHESPSPITSPRTDSKPALKGEDPKPLTIPSPMVSTPSNTTATPKTTATPTATTTTNNASFGAAAAAVVATTTSASHSSKSHTTALDTTPRNAPRNEPQPQPIETLESPKLVSEAERTLQEKVRQESEAQHKKQVEVMEANLSESTTRLRKKHDEELAELKRQNAAAKRSAVSRVEDELHEALQTQQAAVDRRAKSEIQRLEDDVDRMREKVRDVQSSALQQLEKDAQDIERRSKDGLQQKINEIEAEIAQIRVRHAKAQQEAVENETQRLSLEMNRTSLDAKDTVNKDYEIKSAELRAQHDATVKQLRAQAQEDMQKEASTFSGSSDAQTSVNDIKNMTVAEEARIRQQAQSDVSNIKSDSENALASFRAQCDAELALLLRTTASANAASGDALTIIDNEAEEQIRSLRMEHENAMAAWKAQAAQKRQEQLNAVSTKVALSMPSSSSSASSAAEIAAATEAHERAEAALKASLETEALEAERAARSSSVEKAFRDAMEVYVREQKAQRMAEEAAFEASKRAAERSHNDAVAAYEAAVAAARGAAPPTKVLTVTVPAALSTVRSVSATAIQQAIAAARRDAESTMGDETRRLRAQYAEKRSAAVLRMAEELAQEEQTKRRGIDMELNAAAAAASASSSRAANEASAAAVGEGCTPQELESRLRAVREEFEMKERQLRLSFEPQIEANEGKAQVTRQAAASTQAQAAIAAASAAAALSSQQQQQQPSNLGAVNAVNISDGDLPWSRVATPIPQAQMSTGFNSLQMTPQGGGGGGAPFVSPSLGPQSSHTLPSTTAAAAAVVDSDPFQFLSEQQRSLHDRQERLANARHEYVEQSSSQAHHHHHHQHYPQHAASSPYRSSGISAGGQDSGQQLVHVLAHLNRKLDMLTERVHLQEQQQQSSPPNNRRKPARGDEPTNRSRNSTAVVPTGAGHAKSNTVTSTTPQQQQQQRSNSASGKWNAYLKKNTTTGNHRHHQQHHEVVVGGGGFHREEDDGTTDDPHFTDAIRQYMKR